jgi:hypothetical protein
MLDYGNLSFVSAQNPYVALVRSQSRPQVRPRANVEFIVYGWSRRVLYSSVESAPPLGEDAFRRAYASRTPFWATISRGSNSLDAFFLSDRGAIYVLTAERQVPSTTGRGGELPPWRSSVCCRSAREHDLQPLVGRAPASGRALFAEAPASSQVVPRVRGRSDRLLALALCRGSIAQLMLADTEQATRLATVAKPRVQICAPLSNSHVGR